MDDNALTHNSTHDAKYRGGRGGHGRIKEHSVLDGFVQKITKNNIFSSLQAIGKDEVGSSNLPSSSKSTPIWGVFIIFQGV